MKVVQLIDSFEYATSNCWQHQILWHLGRQPVEHELVESNNLVRGRGLPEADVYLSTLKLRSVLRLLPVIKQNLGTKHLYVYDQDPWESFIDAAHCKGAYSTIAGELNVTFINTSQSWVDMVTARGFRALFAPMWIDSKYCDVGTPWASRPIQVGFKGSLHPFRRAALKKLAALGVEVTVLPSGDYSSFLHDLRQMQFFFHEESGSPWTIDGQPIVKNACWAKEVEIVSQGCFALRLHEHEMSAYGLDKIEAVKTYTSLEEVPGIIERALNDTRSDEVSRAGVEAIASQTGWFDILELARRVPK